MGILLGLLTAITWGGSDFLARFATHRIGTLRSMLYMQFTGLILLTIFMPALGGWGHLTDGSGWHPWAWGVLGGAINTCSTLMLYRSFEIGKMSIVAPISASYPAITVALSLLSGERFTVARAGGMACILLGVMVVARGEQTPEDEHPSVTARSGKGLGWACGAAVGFGVLFWLMGAHMVQQIGRIPTVWILRLTCTVLTTIVILLARQPIRLPLDRKTMSLVWGMSTFDNGAFLFNNWALAFEQISVVSILSSLYGAVTVALAALFLREHVSRWQWGGIATIFAGIVLLGRP